MQPISASKLRERLKKEKLVEAGGIAFRIRKIPLLLLADETEDIWEIARQGQEILAQRVKALLASPTLPRMRQVLLRGVVQPHLIERDDDEHDHGVCVDLLLADYQLSSSLYIDIVNFSLES